MSRLRLLMLVAVAGAPFLAGCKKERGADLGKKELVLLCGHSFVPPAEETIARFKARTGVEVVTTVAGSEDFLPLVKAGKKGDVLITHDPYLDYVRDAGALAAHTHVGFVAPVLAVQKGNPKGLKSIADLAKPDLKVALSNPQYSTCGEMVARLLEKKRIKDAVMKNVGNRVTKGHSTLGTFVKTGAVDAVVMWNGVAHTFRDDLEIIETPYEYDTEICVHVIGLNYSKHAELVERFVEFAETEGADIFAKYGYVK